MIRVNDMTLEQDMLTLGQTANQAAAALSIASTDAKNTALNHAAKAIRTNSADIIAANKIDVKNAENNNISAAFIDRLLLDAERVEAIAISLEAVAKLADPVGTILAEWTPKQNGLNIKRKRVPLGVIGVIYESRPNVTADAGALCLKAGNATILRGGSDSINSSKAILTAMQTGLKAANLPIGAIQMVNTTDRAAVGHMLTGLNGNIDVIVPRGGKSLVARVQQEARVPVFSHLEGICHVYIDASADLNMAVDISFNAKLRRTGICGSAETLLIDQAVKDTHLLPIIEKLQAGGCEIRGNDYVQSVGKNIVAATDEDWTTEYLDKIISVKIVANVDAAINHVNHYGSHHTDAIISETPDNVARFFNEVDSAIVIHNASTQYADGGEFGMGAEIGIATGKMHARGPVGVEQLTSFKYVVSGKGQLRP
ncbi:MAG: glutamate-5-semialdehyde dehydrogenase [Alphaproteobacteria bacterium]|nr:glutamate-5-semialdehyde dehydrogenase [Alphaproteobacteria bacterium]